MPTCSYEIQGPFMGTLRRHCATQSIYDSIISCYPTPEPECQESLLSPSPSLKRRRQSDNFTTFKKSLLVTPDESCSGDSLTQSATFFQRPIYPGQALCDPDITKVNIRNRASNISIVLNASNSSLSFPPTPNSTSFPLLHPTYYMSAQEADYSTPRSMKRTMSPQTKQESSDRNTPANLIPLRAPLASEYTFADSSTDTIYSPWPESIASPTFFAPNDAFVPQDHYSQNAHLHQHSHSHSHILLNEPAFDHTYVPDIHSTQDSTSHFYPYIPVNAMAEEAVEATYAPTQTGRISPHSITSISSPSFQLGHQHSQSQSQKGPSKGFSPHISSPDQAHKLDMHTSPRPFFSPQALSSAAQESPALRYQCRLCSQGVFATLPEFRKHAARHEKPYTCPQPSCPRQRTGFSTKNDLDRHRKSKHKTIVNLVTDKTYACAAPNCPKAGKVWPRKDNFRQHCERLHSGMDLDALLKDSLVEVGEALGAGFCVI